MTPEAHFKGVWNGEKEQVHVNVPLILFEEDGAQIVYCPALDVSGYGKDETEAKQSFEVSLGEFFRY